MTTCDKIRPRLTAYLDGELADDHGSVVRGHLRECPDCRGIARDEAALRDGLRALEPLDPPARLWAGVQAQLAAAEVADARMPRWRRAAERWVRWTRSARWTPTMRQLAAASFAGVAAIALITVRGHRADEPVAVVPGPAPEHLAAASPAPTEHLAAPGFAAAAPDDDVTADLIAEPARTTASYDRAVGELMKLAEAERARWSDGDRAAFDARIAGLRGAIAQAGQPRSVQRAQRSLIRYLQGAIVRDDMLLASGGTR
jgi:negative regulator of sigma E activity